MIAEREVSGAGGSTALAMCQVYDSLPDDVKAQIVFRVALVKLDQIMSSSSGDRDKLFYAYSFLDSLVSSGFRDDRFVKLRDYVGSVISVYSVLDTVAKVLSNPVNNIDDAEKTVSNAHSTLKSIIDSPAFNTYASEDLKGFVRGVYQDLDLVLRSGFFGSLRDLIDLANKRIGEINSLVSELRNVQSIDRMREISSKIWYLSAKAVSDISSRASSLDASLATLATSAKTSYVANLINATRDSLSNAVSRAKALFSDFNKFGYVVNGFSENIGNLVGLVSSVGSDDKHLLGNPEFYRYVINQIVNALNFYRFSQQAVSSISDQGLRQASSSVLETYIQNLRDMKRSLGKGDIRWIDVFDEAEKQAMVQLGVSKADVWKDFYNQAKDFFAKYGFFIPPELREALSILYTALSALDMELTKILNSVYEFTKTQLSNSQLSLADKIYYGVGVFSVGVIDSVSIIFRPQTFQRMIQGISEALRGGAENIAKKGLAGLAEDLVAVGQMLCGSIDKCLYTAGNLAGAILVGKAVGKIPAPASIRALVADIVLGDPVSPFLRLIKFPRVLEEARVFVSERAGRVIENSKLFGLERTVENIEKYALQRLGETAYVRRMLDSLKRDFSEILKKSGSVADSINYLRELVAKYGLEGLRVRAVELMNLFDRVLPKTLDPRTLVDMLRVDYSKTLVPRISSESIVRSIPGVNVRFTLFKYEPVKVVPVPRPGLEMVALPAKVGEVVKSISSRVSVETSSAKLLESVKRLGRLEFSIKSLEEFRSGFERLSDFVKDVSRLGSRETAELASRVAEAIKSVPDVAKMREMVSIMREELAKYAKERAVAEKPAEVAKAEATESLGSKLISFIESNREALEKFISRERLNEFIRSIEKASSPEEILREFERRIFPEIDKALTSIGLGVARDVQDLLIRFSKEPAIANLFRTVLSKLDEHVRAYVEKAPLFTVPGEVRAFFSKYKNDILSFITDPGKRSFTEKVIDQIVSSGRVSFSDLIKLGDVLAEISPRLAGITEVSSVLRTLSSSLNELLRSVEGTPVYGIVKSAGDRIYEIASRISERGVVERAVAVEGLSRLQREYLSTISRIVEEINPSLADRLRSVSSELEKSLAKGVVDESLVKSFLDVLGDVSKELKRLGVVTPEWKASLLDFLQKLGSVINKDAKLGRLFSKLADEIYASVSELKTTSEGWGFLDLRLSRESGILVTVPREIRDRLRELFTRGSSVKTVNIGGVEVRLGREISFDPSRRVLTVRYRLTYPGDRFVEFGFSIRSEGGEIFRQVYAYVDPRLTQVMEEARAGKPISPEDLATIRSIEQLIKNPFNLVREFDPDVSLLEHTAVVDSRGVSWSLGDLLKSAASMLYGVSISIPKNIPVESQYLLAESLSAPKEPIINALRGVSSPAPEGLAQFVSEKGYVPVAYLNPDLFASAVILPALSDLLSKNTDLLKRVTGFLRGFINRNRDVITEA
ncbi:MAG: hypothetical protein C0179_07120, partial [Fervidicoccus sp.]